MLQLNNRLDRAKACLQAIEIIHKEIAKYESEEKRAEVAEKYAEDLLIQTEKIMINPSCRNDFLRLIRLFNLDYPINRSSIMNKSNAQIENDFLRWKAVSKSAKLALSSADARINSLM